MDVDEEIQPDEDENSHLSMGVMSDIHEDDTEFCLNSEEEQFLNDNSNSLDQRTDNHLWSNEVNEIENTIETSHLPSSPVMVSNYEGFQSEDAMTINQKGAESILDGKYEIKDTQMESSSVSPKLNDDITYMSTDVKEDIENSPSDVSMSSKSEMHLSLINNKTSVVEISNFSKEVTFNSPIKLDDNLIHDCKTSNVKLHKFKVSQIEENIKVSQKENDSSTSKHDDGSSVLKENNTKNLHTCENSKYTNVIISHTNEISSVNQILDNLSSKDDLLICSNEDIGSLSNLRSKKQDATLQREVDEPKSKTEDDVSLLDGYSDELSDEAVKLSMEEEINTSKHLEVSGFIGKVKEIIIDEVKKNTAISNECSDILTEKSEEIVKDSELKKKSFNDSLSIKEEVVQSKMKEELKKDSKNIDECLGDLSIEAKEMGFDKRAEIDMKVLEKDVKNDFINETVENLMDKETINETKVSNECSDNIVGVEKTKSIEMNNFEILSKNSDIFLEESKEINKDAMILNECSDFAGVENRNATEEKIVNKPQSISLKSDLQECYKNDKKKKIDSDLDTDSDSYVDISDYLINFNKKDYFASPDLISEDSISNMYDLISEDSISNMYDLISEDSISNMYEENNDNEKEKNTNTNCPTEPKLKSLENDKNQIAQIPPEKPESTDETHRIEKKVVVNETSDNSDLVELTIENESYFEVIDEVTEEDTKKNERKLITIEGLAKSSSKNKFIEEAGKEIEDGSFTRVVIVGDSFISNFSKMWPENSKIKPYFLSKDNITLTQILRSKIQEHVYLNNSEKIFVLFICGLHELSSYSTYKFHGCRSTHAPFKYISKVKNDSHTLNYILKEMTILKKKLEKCNGVFVAFSYLPVIDTALINHTLSELSRSKNFNCSCNFSLGSSSTVKSANSIYHINRNIFYRNLNETKVNGIFEFSPVNITYYMDCWCMYSKKLKLKENSDILILSYLLDQYVYAEADVKSNIRISDSGSCLPAHLHAKTSNKPKMLIIGDSWIKSIAEMWDIELDVKPYFYCKNGLTLDCIQKVITSITRTGEKLLVIAAIPSGEFLTICKFSECKDHSKLEYPVPNGLLLKDSFAYAEYVIKKLDLLSLNVEASGCSKIIFLTCYPAFFKNYYKNLYQKHIKNISSHRNSKNLVNVHDCLEFDAKVENCFTIVNKHVATLNKELGIPTCNIFSLMQKLSSNNKPVFPTEAMLISQNVRKRVLQLFEKYVCSLYNENISISSYKGKLDEKNSKKETISDMILKDSISDMILKKAEIKVKIENKFAGKSNKSNPEEPSESNRIVIYKEKKKKSILDKNLVQSSDNKFKKKDTKESFNELYESENKNIYHSKTSFSDYYRHDSSNSCHCSNEEYFYQSDHHTTTSDRYESHSKHSRDLAFHVKNRSFTRSRSKDRRRSRSIGRRYSKDRKYIRSRSKDRALGRNKNRDIKRSRSRSRNRNKRPISRSRSSSKKRARRNRSPYRKVQESKYNSSKGNRNYRSKSRSKSQNHSSNKLEFSREFSSLEKNALAALWEAHSRECEMYRKNPENHPDHDRVKRMWLDIMNMQGLNTLDSSVLQFWWDHWLKKMEEIMKASWEEKKLNCLAVLSSKRKTSKSSVSSDSCSSDSDYETHTKIKERWKSKNFISKKISRNSPSRSMEKEKFNISDNLPTSVDEMEKLLQEFVKKNSKNYEGTSSKLHPVEKAVSKTSALKGSEVLDVFSILCQISDKFGALGMSLTVLRQKAIECVKNNLNPYNCIDEDAKMLLDLINGKIKKILENSEMTFIQRSIVQEAHDRLAPFLESFESSKESSYDIESLAKATLGLQVSEVVDFIRANLEYKGHKKVSQQNLMDLYMKVKSYQANILDISRSSSSRASSFFL